MLDDSWLAQIADLYTPLLLLVALGLCVSRHFYLSVRRLTYLLIAAVWVYGLMWLDSHWQLWASFGGDYSTHTAAALALVVFNGSLLCALLAWITLATSLLAYGELMFYLGYHSWADMLSTAAVVALGLWAGYRLAPVSVKLN
jgi:hypothetical protein